jgi:hypothetical protein
VTQPGIDPGTVPLVAQRLNHYATTGHIYIYIYKTKLASNEIFSPSNKIHREVGQAKNLSAPLYVKTLYQHQRLVEAELDEMKVHGQIEIKSKENIMYREIILTSNTWPVPVASRSKA